MTRDAPHSGTLRAATKEWVLVTYPEMSSSRALWCLLCGTLCGPWVVAFDTQTCKMSNLANGGHLLKPVLKGLFKLVTSSI